MALAQSAGTFTATGSMTTARSGHTATLLLDGKVLIAGGSGASAELYDPSTGTFTRTGDMTTVGSPTATLLPDGRVLIAGGNVGGGRAGTSAEIYDPSNGTFTATGSMAASHWRATLLNNGKVLMSGGYTQTTPSTVPSAEIYDPSTGTFTVTGDDANTAAIYYSGRTATLLPGGRVLITNIARDLPASPAELYDPVTGTFSLTGAMNTGAGTATLLPNGKVLVAGGTNSGDWPLEGAELYDPSTGTFAAAGNMTAIRDVFSATLLPGGTVLIAGGSEDRPYRNAELYTGAGAELYNPSTGTFSSIGNMTSPRYNFAATVLNDGRVLITGGYYWAGIPVPPPRTLSSAELYTPAVLVPAPVLFSLSVDGRGQGAILHAGTTRVVSASDPAVAGEALEIYCAGLIDGNVVPPQVAIGGRMAEILYLGNAPGFAGLNQVNVRVPSSVAPASVVPVRLTYLGRHSNEVTIGVR